MAACRFVALEGYRVSDRRAFVFLQAAALPGLVSKVEQAVSAASARRDHRERDLALVSV